MKYIVFLADGMADYPIPALGGRTPMQAADKPNMNFLAARGETGLARTLFEGFPTGSDTANISVLGYDPRVCYTGRSPIEALGLGIFLKDGDTVFRLNLVTLSSGDIPFSERIILDHSAGKITNEEAYALLAVLAAEFSSEEMKFYEGVSYRHIMVWNGVDYDYTMTPPHDILEKKIGPYLPGGRHGARVLSMMARSYEILNAHPVNRDRVARGLNPANCIWLWGEGTRPSLPDFYGRYGLTGAAVTAVPLIKGLAVCTGLTPVDVPGATGDYHTNYAGKAEAALRELTTKDFVFLHVEAPDECGHDGDAPLKTRSIERIDREVVGPVIEELRRRGEPFRAMVLPDHATPVSVRTHTVEPVPFLIYDSRRESAGKPRFDEDSCAASGLILEEGFRLMPRFLEKK